jgi:hypothetical protein
MQDEKTSSAVIKQYLGFRYNITKEMNLKTLKEAQKTIYIARLKQKLDMKSYIELRATKWWI